MTNNDVLRRLRYALNLPDGLSQKILALGGRPTPDAVVSSWLRRDDEPGFVGCSDAEFSAFLDGYIVLRRGPSPVGSPPRAPERLTNNLILKKLRIALAWHEDEVLAALSAGGMTLSNGELTALFRKPGQKNFRPCGDQVLKAFLVGLAGRVKPAS